MNERETVRQVWIVEPNDYSSHIIFVADSEEDANRFVEGRGSIVSDGDYCVYPRNVEKYI